MPIEIKELVIKATIDDQGSQSGGGQGGAPASQKQEIVEMCVEQVLEILKEKQER